MLNRQTEVFTIRVLQLIVATSFGHEIAVARLVAVLAVLSTLLVELDKGS